MTRSAATKTSPHPSAEDHTGREAWQAERDLLSTNANSGHGTSHLDGTPPAYMRLDVDDDVAGVLAL